MVPHRIQTGTGMYDNYGGLLTLQFLWNLTLSGNHLVLCVLRNWLCSHLETNELLKSGLLSPPLQVFSKPNAS